jgi:hypothetical protein
VRLPLSKNNNRETQEAVTYQAIIGVTYITRVIYLTKMMTKAYQARITVAGSIWASIAAHVQALAEALLVTDTLAPLL